MDTIITAIYGLAAMRTFRDLQDVKPDYDDIIPTKKVSVLVKKNRKRNKLARNTRRRQRK